MDYNYFLMPNSVLVMYISSEFNLFVNYFVLYEVFIYIILIEDVKFSLYISVDSF